MARRAQPERLVLGISGRIGAGKTSAGKYISYTYGCQYIRYSEVLADWLAKDPERRAHLQEVGWEVMAGGKQAELNRRLIARIKPDSDAVVDGLRHVTDYDALRNSFGTSFRLLYVESSAEARFAHLEAAGKYQDRDSFDAADSHPVEQQIESLRANASLVLRNENSLEALYDKVDKAIRKLGKEG